MTFGAAAVLRDVRATPNEPGRSRHTDRRHYPQAGIHENTFYVWKKRFGGLGTPEIRELRQLRDENAKLKKLVADLSLDRQMLQEIVAKQL